MKLDWKISDFNEEDLSAMLSITKENYGDIEISDENFIKWQYFDNSAGNAIIKVAKSMNDEVVGQYIIIPIKMKVNDEVITSTLSLNTLTRKDYRGKGIFTGLANAVYQDCRKNNVDFTYGFPNQNSYPGFIKKLEFVDLGEVPLMLYPLDIKKLVEKKYNNNLLATISGMAKLAFRINFKKNDKFEVREICDDYNQFDEFWERIKNKYKVIGVRNYQYIKWRYIDIPEREYKIIGVFKNKKLIGYAVIRNSNIEDFRCGMIVDFIMEENEKKAAEYLISKILNIFKESKMELVGCLISKKTEEYKILKNCKFVRCPKFLEPQPFKVIYRNHSDKNDEILTNLDNWFLTMGDYDVI